MAGKRKATGEMKYSRDEIVHNAVALFQVHSDIAVGALHNQGNERHTIDEAKSLIGQFMKRKVL